MAQVVHDVQQEFWRPPVTPDSVSQAVAAPTSAPAMAETCARCGTEFMIGSRFCHTCGAHRPQRVSAAMKPQGIDFRALLQTRIARLHSAIEHIYQHKLKTPSWLRYLHFHEIKRLVGLPTPSLIAFMIGVGCLLGALGVSIVYHASNLAEFQAVQMWRIQWLLGATASFVAGILLKAPSGTNRQ